MKIAKTAKTARSFFILTLIVLLFSGMAFAQKSRLKSLAPDASLAETQEWLAKAIKEAGSLDHRKFRTVVLGLSFEGCHIFYFNTVKGRPKDSDLRDHNIFALTPAFTEIDPSRASIPGTGPDANVGTSTRSAGFSGGGSRVSYGKSKIFSADYFSFDLGRMDPALTSEKTIDVAGTGKKAVLLTMASKDAVVKTVKASIPAWQTSANLTLQPADAPAIKAALTRAIGLCRAK